MKKITKFLALALVLVLSLGMLAGCGGNSSNSGGGSGNTGGSSSSTGDDSSGGGSAEKAEVYLLIKARGDLSFWDSMAEGGDRAATELADKANVHIIETTADTQANLTAMYEAVDKGADLIFTGGDFLDNMMTVADEYPDVAFVLLDEKLPDGANVPNIYAVQFATSHAGFLAGICAADVAEANGSKVVGFVGGMDEQVIIQECFMGYIQGAKYYDPEVSVVYNYVGDWGDPEKGKTQALAQYKDMGAEVVFAFAGGSGNGVHQAAAEVGKYVIGADSDQSLSYAEHPETQKAFVTSVLKLLGNCIFDLTKQFVETGDLPLGERHILGLAEDAVGIVENDLFNEYVSDHGKELIAEATAGVKDGSLEIIGAMDKDQATIQAEIAELLG